MRLIVKTGREEPFFVDVREKMTILDVKKAIWEVSGIKQDAQRLILRGHVLPDNVGIDRLKLVDMSTIYLSEDRKKLKRCDRNGVIIRPYFGDITETANYSAFMEVLKTRSPHFSHALMDREALQETVETYARPGAAHELMKMADRTMDMVEARTGGLRDLIARQATVEAILEEVMDKFRASTRPPLYNRTVIPTGKPKGPSAGPLPFECIGVSWSRYGDTEPGFIVEWNDPFESLSETTFTVWGRDGPWANEIDVILAQALQSEKRPDQPVFEQFFYEPLPDPRRRKNESRFLSSSDDSSDDYMLDID
jgi:hypothetical protein